MKINTLPTAVTYVYPFQPLGLLEDSHLIVIKLECNVLNLVFITQFTYIRNQNFNQTEVFLTIRCFDVIHRISVELHHLGRFRFLFFVAAHCKSVLGNLNQHVVSFFPFLPDGFSQSIQIAAMLHVERFIHSTGDFDTQILIG